MKITLLASFILMLGFIGMGYMHEMVHIEIFRSYEIESHMEWFSHFPDLVTIAEEPCPTEECNLAHNINEAITYPIEIIFLTIGLLMILIILLKERELEMCILQKN